MFSCKFYKTIKFYLILNCILLYTCNNGVNSWREASKCTTSINSFDSLNDSNDNTKSGSQITTNSNDPSDSNHNTAQVLELNCGTNLIFIASSHYGHRTLDSSKKLKENKLQNNLFHLENSKNNSSINEASSGCYFSSEDCLVTVDYVANECNGLSSCQISLDAQYLHSCKSYSDYLFIIYDCVEAKSTVNICDGGVDLEVNSLSNSNEGDSVVYIQTPKYPNEYLSNMDCNCSMRTSGDSSIQIELLEFDLESSNDNSLELSNKMSSNGNNNNNNLNNQNSIASIGIDFKTRTRVQNANLQGCLRDYFNINSNNQLCGTLSQFSSLLNVQREQNDLVEPNNPNNYHITNFRFYSDDALTRRGFWIKVKVSKMNIVCPENFLLIDNVCLRVYNELLTWYEAHNYCSQLGYSLALIDNFELEKKLNKVIFDNEEVSKSLFGINQTSNINSNENLKKFWIGIRHLNKTNWFDHKNDLIQFRDDEKNWWPWLIVDSRTYNQGSCVGKRRNSFFLEDCYKRMPFACQYKQEYKSKQSNSKIQLKCGKNSNLFFKTQTSTTTTTKANTFKLSSVENMLNKLIGSDLATKSYKIDSVVDLQLKNNSIKRIEEAAKEANAPIFIKDASVISKNSDSTLLISLICGIALLIALINTVVIVLICKRRRLFIDQDKTSSHKDSKMSSNSSSSGNNINLDDSNGTDTGIDSSSTLTFNGGVSIKKNMNITNCLNSQAGLFMDNFNDDTSLGIKTMNQNMRHSVFVTDFDHPKLKNVNNFGQIKTLMHSKSANINSINAGLNNNNVNRTLSHNHKVLNTQLNNKNLNQNDPLSHIYETISVSSITNGNMNGAKARYNQYNLCNQNPANNYIELDNGQSGMLFNYDSANEHTASTDYSSSSQQSQDYFRLFSNLNTTARRNNFTLQQAQPFNTAKYLLPTKANNDILKFISNQNQMRMQHGGLGGINHPHFATVNTSSPSSSSLVTTTLTDIGNNNNNQHQHLNGEDFRFMNNNNLVSSFNTGISNNHFMQQHQHQQQRFHDNFLLSQPNNNTINNNNNSAIVFSNRIEAVV